jgi:hypothetical protein
MRTAMNTLLPTLLGAIVLIAGLGSQAQAQSVYAGLLGGYAASADKENDVEPYGVGVGASAGVTLPVFPMFLGARVLYFFGDDASFGAGSGRVTLDSHYLMYGLDLGYDATLGPVTLRPGLGIGRATVDNSGSAIGVTVSASDSSLYLAPGMGVLVTVLFLYVGAEVRFNYLTEDEHQSSTSLLASFGFTL